MQEMLFLVEGTKSVLEFLGSNLEVKEVLGTEVFWQQNSKQIEGSGAHFELASETDLKQAGTLATNNAALALVSIPESLPVQLEEGQWSIALDHINDPGNLGTIIRIADWYGIEQVILSEDSVDAYNPKTVSASKGSLTRVHISYANLRETLSGYSGTILGADMHGKDVHSLDKLKGGVLLMGSESHGISDELKGLITKQITIPRIGGAESLNVAVATAIICDNLVGR